MIYGGTSHLNSWNLFTDDIDLKRILPRCHFFGHKKKMTINERKNDHKVLNSIHMQYACSAAMYIVKRPYFAVRCCEVLKWKTVRLLNRLNRIGKAKNSFSSSLGTHSKTDGTQRKYELSDFLFWTQYKSINDKYNVVLCGGVPPSLDTSCSFFRHELRGQVSLVSFDEE